MRQEHKKNNKRKRVVNYPRRNYGSVPSPLLVSNKRMQRYLRSVYPSPLSWWLALIVNEAYLLWRRQRIGAVAVDEGDHNGMASWREDDDSSNNDDNNNKPPSLIKPNAGES